jgi:dihydrofolate reductase
MRVSLIVAVSENGAIGRGGGLPWRLPADLRRFKQLTMGHTIIMGRRTWDSIGRPLPGRRSIVLSRDPGLRLEGAEVAGSIEEALGRCTGEDQVFVIGGREAFEAALPRAQRIHLTRVHAEVEGDVHFPEGALDGFQLVTEERHDPGEGNRVAYTFQTYERR